MIVTLELQKESPGLLTKSQPRRQATRGSGMEVDSKDSPPRQQATQDFRKGEQRGRMRAARITRGQWGMIITVERERGGGATP